MKRSLLKLFFAAASVAACTGLGSPNQSATSDMIEAIGAIADTGLACLVERSVLEPKVTYDVVKTDSLIDPVLGLIEVEVSETAFPLPNGTPMVTIRSKYELTFTYTDGDWLLKDLVVVRGRRLKEGDPLQVCFP